MNPAEGAIRARTSGLSRWQERHIFSWASLASASFPSDRARVRGCWWQLRQSGAPFTEAAKALPCADSANGAVTSRWQAPHDSTRRAGANGEAGSLGDRTSWVPWHALHEAAGPPSVAGDSASWGWNGCFSVASPW